MMGTSAMEYPLALALIITCGPRHQRESQESQEKKDLHLKDIGPTLDALHQIFQHIFFIQTEASCTVIRERDKKREGRGQKKLTCQIAHTRVEHEVGKKICTTANDNTFQIPSSNLPSLIRRELTIRKVTLQNHER
jgi:hypothetical protein